MDFSDPKLGKCKCPQWNRIQKLQLYHQSTSVPPQTVKIFRAHSVLVAYELTVANLQCPSAIPQTSRFTETGWPSHTVCQCPGGIMRSVQLVVLVTESYLQTLFIVLNCNLCEKFISDYQVKVFL